MGATTVVSSSASIDGPDNIQLAPALTFSQQLDDELSIFILTEFVSSLLVILKYLTSAPIYVPEPMVVPNSNRGLTFVASKDTIWTDMLDF